jgi:hypothetical protein
LNFFLLLTVLYEGPCKYLCLALPKYFVCQSHHSSSKPFLWTSHSSLTSYHTDLYFLLVFHFKLWFLTFVKAYILSYLVIKQCSVISNNVVLNFLLCFSLHLPCFSVFSVFSLFYNTASIFFFISHSTLNFFQRNFEYSLFHLACCDHSSESLFLSQNKQEKKKD